MKKRVTMTEIEKKYDIHFCKNHTGKMNGLTSISTSPLCNTLCKTRCKNPNSICSHCYSMNMQKMYKGLKENLIDNYNVLTSVIIPKKEIPFLISETGLFRFEAFGDLENEIQVVNYFNMANKNKHMSCALWTKNPWIIKSAIDKYNLKKPSNLKIIGSSYNTNEPMTDFYKRYDFIDNVFTVYDKKFIKKHDINITCGSRSCANCQKCYIGGHDSFEINEKKK